MKFISRGHLAILLAWVCSTVMFAQSGTIQIEFIGNCGLHFTDGDTHLYVDFPYKSGAHNYMEFDAAALDSIQDSAFFLFTHRHYDHYSRKDIKQAVKHKMGQKFDPWNIDELESLARQIPEFSIEAYKTKHKVFGISFKHYSYLITWHGKKIYLSGDTENPKTIGQMEGLDWAFIPFWIYQNARTQNISIPADQIAIYHLYPGQVPSAIEFFKNKTAYHPLTHQGQSFSLSY